MQHKTTSEVQCRTIADLEERVANLEQEIGDQEREHDDIVARLAQSLSSLGARKNKSSRRPAGSTRDKENKIDGGVVEELGKKFMGARLVDGGPGE